MKSRRVLFDALEPVSTLNRIAGKTPRKPSDPDYWDVAQAQADLIQSELNEVFKAIKNKDIEQLRDGACDINVTNLGLFYRNSLPYNQDMRAVIHQLFSRFCKTEDEADQTVVKYAKINVDVRKHLDEMTGYWVILSSKDQRGLDGEDYPEGKWLKSVNAKKCHFVALESTFE